MKKDIENLKTWPEKIYLDPFDKEIPNFHQLKKDAYEVGYMPCNVTGWDEQFSPTTIEYTRSDLISLDFDPGYLLDEIELLKNEIKFLKAIYGKVPLEDDMYYVRGEARKL